MAVVKGVSSHAGIGRAIDYVTQEEKTEEKLISGYNLDPNNAEAEMQMTKEAWHKTGGRTYKHYVQSFHADEQITTEQAHAIAKEFVEKCDQFKGFEVLIATHKDREHIHTHFIVNSVNAEDGHKFRQNKHELHDLRNVSDEICKAHGLTITEKGKTFHGEEREETSTWTKEAYRTQLMAENDQQPSYILNIALAVQEEREQATSREDFISRMNDRGIGVDWQDNHKYITFTDLERQEQGEKKCKIRNNKLEQYYNTPFGKEELTNEFEINAGKEAERTATADRARQQLHSLDRGAVTEDNGAIERDRQAQSIHQGEGQPAQSGTSNLERLEREQAFRERYANLESPGTSGEVESPGRAGEEEQSRGSIQAEKSDQLDQLRERLSSIGRSEESGGAVEREDEVREGKDQGGERQGKGGGISREVQEPADSGEVEDIGAFLDNLNAKEERAGEIADNSGLERANREAERSRLNAERERAAREAQRRAEAEREAVKRTSRSYSFHR
ncbi:MAG: relaxase/mobilization nuclease domain-containing protein [Lachnospiraceae bacterium]|nr:relaxase/mobilization nuclease domain-containing protein [Lachnospiraceae bacterium]